MFRALFLIFAVTTWFTVQAITITIDRADVKTLQPQSSMTINGWRPVTTRYEEIGVNVSPATNLERNVGALHPVINKLQEHMATSERLKPQRKAKPQDYNPPSILGSFTVFGHAAAKARGEVPNSEKKYMSKETKEYSFLIPPPRDTLRFEIDSHKKSVMRENDAYIRASQYVPQVHKPDIRGSAYYIKSPVYSTTVHPMLAVKNRPVSSAYNAQSAFLPQRQSLKASAFESLKVGTTNTNKYAHVPKSDLVQPMSEHAYERYTPQSHITTVNGNFYNQVSHSPQNYKTTFERDPSFLVHESHEIGYVTQPFEYKYRHPVSFESLIRPDLYPSTNAPRTDGNKYAQQVNNYRNEQVKSLEQKRNNPVHPTEKSVRPTYYVAEAHHEFLQSPGAWHMKQHYKPDINEVLPKANSPTQFNQQSHVPPIHPAHFTQSQKVLFIRPELQQQKQSFQSSIIPLNINQRPQEVDYETPESVSLKHFNEQQFMLQHQLIEQDRRRLREQEILRRKQLEKQEREEISKKQEELRLLEQQRQQEQANLQQQTNLQQQDFKKEIPKRKQNIETPKQTVKLHNHRYTERTKPKQETIKSTQEMKVQTTQIPSTQQHFYEIPHVSTEPTFLYTGDAYSNQQGQKYDISNVNDYYTTQPVGIQIDAGFRRPQADPRDPLWRKKSAYENTSTESATETFETETYTEIPIQTTTWEAFSTTPTPEKIRTRKPTSNSTPRKRRPSSTTSEPETIPTSNYGGQDFYKYEKQEVSDISKRRRPKPQSNNDASSSAETKKPSRKRPNHRTNHPSSSEKYSEVTSEPVNTNSYDNKKYENQNYENQKYEIKNYKNQKYENSYEKYSDAKNDSYITEYTPTYSQANPTEYQPEVVTENVATEYPNVQVGKLTKFEYYEPAAPEVHSGQFNLQQNDENLPLEHLFIRTEPNNYETTTSASYSEASYLNSITPTRTTIKISKSQEVSKAIITTSASTTMQPAINTTKGHHQRIRPLRYGNATRPRFSVKDYKTRMDLKNKIAQNSGSTTEQPIRKRPTSQRNAQQASIAEVRETTGRYKYMSRVSYKTSTTTPSTFDSEKVDSGSTTEKTKYTPKRRLNPSLYRSRFSKPSNTDGSVTQNTSRPETSFTSVRRRVPGSKTSDRNGEKRGPVTEMAAEETSFYSPPTTSQYTESVNEISVDKESSQTLINQNDNETPKSENNPENIVSQSSTTVSTRNLVETGVTFNNNKPEQGNSDIASSSYDAQLEEDLFVKASQSVADLTSSASALYNKPGLFKAVSSAQENRKSKNKLQITTEEPTLPIEAFFQELSKKID